MTESRGRLQSQCFFNAKNPSATNFQVLLHTMRETRNVQQWIMKVHQCQLSFILITNSPCL